MYVYTCTYGSPQTNFTASFPDLEGSMAPTVRPRSDTGAWRHTQ